MKTSNVPKLSRLLTAAAMVSALVIAVPATAAPKTGLVATAAGYVIPYFEVTGGEVVDFRSDATPGGHTFTTAVVSDPLCVGASGQPSRCDVPVSSLGMAQIRIHPDAPIGLTWDFKCTRHPWMIGQVTVVR